LHKRSGRAGPRKRRKRRASSSRASSASITGAPTGISRTLRASQRISTRPVAQTARSSGGSCRLGMCAVTSRGGSELAHPLAKGRDRPWDDEEAFGGCTRQMAPSHT
jgi:hypothetical protein